MEKVILGSHAVAYAVKLCKPQVIAAFPITPQTSIIEKLAEFCATGELRARFIMVESEHSGMAALIGASSAGSRTFTATSSQGLALMHEVLHWAAGARLPIVMVNGNRALGPPWNLGPEHTDSLSQRDTGWLQFYCESGQEALDTVIQAYRIAEGVLLPAMVALDGYYLTHTAEPVDIPDETRVDEYLPPYRPMYKLDVREPSSFGGYAGPELYMEFRYKMQEAMLQAIGLAKEADLDFRRLFGRGYGIVDSYMLEDADIALVAAGTIAGTARETVERRRKAGERVGLLRIRLFRPFPRSEVRQALAGVSRVAVIDRDISFGHEGIISQELKAALYPGGPAVHGFVAGLGGRDVTPDDLEEALDRAQREEPEEAVWLGVKP